MNDPDQPSLPYADPETGRSSGWSGSDTSADRARRDDTDGTTSARQRLVMRLLRDAGARGLTWRELAGITGMHHGQASGALSNLHKDGRIARLVERRAKCHPYVLPSEVGDRLTQPHGGGKHPKVTIVASHDRDALATAWAEGYVAALAWSEDIGRPEPDNPYEQETTDG